MNDGCKRPQARGFTLIELLVVIAIIAILAGILIPTLAAAKKKGQTAKAQAEINNLAASLNQYYATYSRFPSSKDARTDSTTASPDFTFGTFKAGRNLTDAVVNKTGFQTTILGGGKYQTNNSEVMAILMNVRDWQTKQPNHPENPQGQQFYSPKSVDNTTSAGLGTDGVLRDPWGNPYIITVDLDYNNQCRDAFYRLAAVSESSKDKGFNGLFNPATATRDPNAYESRQPVMVWSLGPDGAADATVKANTGVNKDNVLSWK